MTGEDELLRIYDLYMSGKYSEALPGLEAHAKRGSALAQFCLALMYRDGEGVQKDLQKSDYWRNELIKLAEAGDVAAQKRLAFAYRFGDLFPVDVSRANFWLQKCAAAGDHEAEYHLFLYLRDGRFGYEVDLDAAEQWLLRAVRGGYPEALWACALKTVDSEGRPTEEGLNMIRTAAAAGLPPAQEFMRRHSH